MMFYRTLLLNSVNGTSSCYTVPKRVDDGERSMQVGSSEWIQEKRGERMNNASILCRHRSVMSGRYKNTQLN